LQEDKNVQNEKIDDKQGHKDQSNETQDNSKLSGKILFITFLAIVLILASILSMRFFIKNDPKTLEDLHNENLDGKLTSEEGYLYNGLSFVFMGGMWHTSITSPSGRKVYNLVLRYGPKDVEGLKIQGALNTSLFNKYPNYYVTFNPVGSDFAHVAAAVNDFNQHMINAFNKQPVPACDKNETEACSTLPIINCSNTENSVLYIKEAEELTVNYQDNCILITGHGFDLVKGVDRVILDFYRIMK